MDRLRLPVNPAQAAAALLRRRRARGSLLEYARTIDVPGAPADDTPEADPISVIERGPDPLPHHVTVMLGAIERTIRKHRGRLIIMAPPGSAKSSYVSVTTPAWAMQLPGAGGTEYRCILASYASDLAEGQSRRARSLVQQKKHTAIYPRGGLKHGQRAASDWKLDNGAEFMARGFMSGITGNRADLLLVDDPLKNREQADSSTVRKKISDEFRESAKTRLKPSGSIIIIMTRWHEDDLVGEILPEDYAGESGMIQGRDGQTWEVLNIPAEAEHLDDPLGRPLSGDARWLWPQWFTEEHWLEFKNDPRAARTWSALYQQRPSPATGLQFQRVKVRWYDPDNPRLPPPGTPGYGDETSPAGPPKIVRQYGASDWATKDDGGDFTEHGLMGMDHIGNMIFRDWWSGQKETDVGIFNLNKMVARHRDDKDSASRVHRWYNEGGPIDKAIKPAINRAMREYEGGHAYVSHEAMPSIKDKEIKLLSFHARWNSGTVWFPVRREWAQKVVDALVKFPTGKYDDKPDVCGLLGRGIDKMGTAALPSIDERRPGLVPFSAAWLEYSEQKAPTVRYW